MQIYVYIGECSDKELGIDEGSDHMKVMTSFRSTIRSEYAESKSRAKQQQDEYHVLGHAAGDAQGGEEVGEL